MELVWPYIRDTIFSVFTTKSLVEKFVNVETVIGHIGTLANPKAPKASDNYMQV